MPEQLEVKLFVCPEPGCRQIGKLPVTDVGGTIKGWCRGPIKEPHRKYKMVSTLFKEAK